MLVVVLNMPEHSSFQDMLFPMLFISKYAKSYASIMDISLSKGSIFVPDSHEISSFVERPFSEKNPVEMENDFRSSTSEIGHGNPALQTPYYSNRFSVYYGKRSLHLRNTFQEIFSILVPPVEKQGHILGRNNGTTLHYQHSITYSRFSLEF